MELSLSKLDAFFLGVVTAFIVVILLLTSGSIRQEGGRACNAERSGVVEFMKVATSVAAIVWELWKVSGRADSGRGAGGQGYHIRDNEARRAHLDVDNGAIHRSRFHRRGLQESSDEDREEELEMTRDRRRRGRAGRGSAASSEASGRRRKWWW
ncbi:hypothetical protein PF007_g10415 [Phytophthora fragariae]|uniref:Uncharacterized protein n=1 Tax=Phytophthora fragariae TaxID=53985 RepID=A0A6A3SE43_9STRA|nr:hypothetical protein PF007_g10415 [Phytophthora fragariae]